MQKCFKILFISIIFLGNTGCKEAVEQISAFQPTESADQAYQLKLNADLKAFDQIRTQQNIIFFELDEQLRNASKKETSTVKLRTELQSFSNTLAFQNDSFKHLHFQTTEVAKLRNTIMQLNYATIQIIQVIDNPQTVNQRLSSYLSKKKNFINSYNKMRTEIEAKL